MRAEPAFAVDACRDGAIVVVRPRGEIDLATLGRVRVALGRYDHGVVILDLGEVTFIDSAGLHLIVDEHKRAQREGFEFRLRRGSATIQRLFDMTGLTRHMRWTSDPVEPSPQAGRSNV